MKLIVAIVQPNRLEAVKAALADVEVFRVTVMDAQGYGQQRGKTEVYRGREFTVSLLRKVQLMIAVNDEFLQPAIDTIVNASPKWPGRGGRRRQNLRFAAGRLHPHPHGRARRRSHIGAR